MRKIVLIPIIILIGIGAAVTFFVVTSLKEPFLQGSPKLPSSAFLESLVSRHPEGKTYVAELLKARGELQDQEKENDFSAMLNMGVNLNFLGEKEMALAWYQKALQQDPRNLLALNNVANLYDDLGRYDKAEETWLRLIETYPDKTQFWRSLGYLYRYRLHKSSGDIEAFFVRGFQATNNNPDLVNWLLSYFLETGQNEKFVEYANRFNANPGSR